MVSTYVQNTGRVAEICSLFRIITQRSFFNLKRGSLCERSFDERNDDGNLGAVCYCLLSVTMNEFSKAETTEEEGLLRLAFLSLHGCVSPRTLYRLFVAFTD